MQKPAIVILGVGRLGSALACLARDYGYPLTAITAGHRETAVAFSEATSIPAYFDNVEAAAQGDIILITVSDRILPVVLEELIAGKRLRSGQVLLHTSGVLAGEALAAARQFGTSVGSMHPLQSFADIETARRNLSGSAFAIDGDPEAVAAASRLAIDLGGKLLRVPPEERVLYHAAACIASNYLVALLHVAEKLLARWTTEDKEALQALLPLVAGTLRNVAQQGTSAALTGPIIRGDASTVGQHLKALPQDFLNVYQILGQEALKLSGDRIPVAEREAIASLLSADKKNH
ncbi:hypothetical protein AXX12_11905 [Anaerosporomusa subterranea]|uniref:NADP oxidoreductase n=1 Tax=Anaerosporomusa subterranea TaxID=1794912 RepID=A0A154BPQ6_ANASB|nr:Rossmann-like and DUF2520 domain-containing protein [Anaerosporomusa subterranea]KYZ75891.1 hypothetical protein AXX12_11905 [Anaerosporomusa subterranea]